MNDINLKDLFQNLRDVEFKPMTDVDFEGFEGVEDPDALLAQITIKGRVYDIIVESSEVNERVTLVDPERGETFWFCHRSSI